MKHSRIARRSGFTLIELLVVIAIIAVLGGLLLGAIMKAWATSQVVYARNNIAELEGSIADFKQTFQVSYLPSLIQAGDPFFGKMYPDANPNWPTCPPQLQGSQCLIFFLGGVNGQGFSSNPQAPWNAFVPGEQRIGPFCEFKKIPAKKPTNGHLCDVYGTPLAYFSTTGTPNSYIGTECQDIGCPAPYVEPDGTTYLKPDSFQIISAGADLEFNPINRWPGATGFGRDDVSNFATAILGSGQ